MASLGTCRCCSSEAQLEQGICPDCARTHGPRAALLLARCQTDPDFANAFLARMPEALRARFVAVLSAKCLAPRHGASMRAAAERPGLRYTRPQLSVKSRASA